MKKFELSLRELLPEERILNLKSLVNSLLASLFLVNLDVLLELLLGYAQQKL